MHRPVLAAVLTVVLAAPAHADADPASDGRGWTIRRLDVEVTIEPERERFTVKGEAELTLDALDASLGPTLYVNTRQTKDGTPAFTFTRVEAEGATTDIVSGQEGDDSVAGHVRFPEARPRGTRLNVRFEAETREAGSQLAVSARAAIASWTAAWHPFTNATAEEDMSLTAGVLSVPGRTTLRMPANWVGLVDGRLVERRVTGDEAVETWTSENVARSFVAGPYETSIERVGDREVRVYFLPGDKAITRDRLARLIADTMAAQEARFGSFPFPSYGVVEFPDDVPAQDWYAASQQTFITAKSRAFDYAHGNLPLWGHEMCHGWWGNTVGSRGEGSKWCGESLAQLGAYVAIEALEGEAALSEFLRFSRDGYSPSQCAAGYFNFIQGNEDLPIATMGSDPGTHTLADSKGSWIYHMLRRKIGDDVFFGVLRDIIREEAGSDIDVADIRSRFVDAAPDANLETFFAQWLDRTGAPVFDVDWHATTSGNAAVVRLEQVQPGEPFHVDLDVALSLADGSTVVESIPMRERTARVRIATPARAVGIELDPTDALLHWRPAYGPRPGDVLDETPVPDEVRHAVVGHYRFMGIQKDVHVFEREGVLFVQPAGSGAYRLSYRGDGVFEVDTPRGVLVQAFDLSASPAPSLTSREGDESYVAERIED